MLALEDIPQGARIQPLEAVIIERVASLNEKQSPGFLNKCIGNHSESLSFFPSFFIFGEIEKKRGTQNDSLECQ